MAKAFFMVVALCFMGLSQGKTTSLSSQLSFIPKTGKNNFATDV
jgi:hypothetical protein